jgi:hypothetical protein
MSTQYTDHDMLERTAPPRAAPRHTLHGTARPSQHLIEPLLDHHQLATRWLIQEECIQALRVADSARTRFSPFRQTPDPEAPRHWLHHARHNPSTEEAHNGLHAPLNIKLRWVIWRNPYGNHE